MNPEQMLNKHPNERLGLSRNEVTSRNQDAAKKHREKIFLETSIHIERLFSSKQRREQIQRRLSGATLYTSSYVWMEFRRSVLQTYAYLASIVRGILNEGTKQIEIHELIRRLSAAPSIRFIPRAIQRLLLILSSLLEAFPGRVVHTEKLIDYFEYNITHLGPDGFFLDIDEFINETSCDLVRPGVEIGDYVHKRLSCNAAKASCALVPFLEAHRAELLTLEKVLVAAPPEKKDSQTLAALRKVNADVTKAKGERTCWALGDIIIKIAQKTSYL
jgi:predicted nucleic acid-binding protein